MKLLHIFIAILMTSVLESFLFQLCFVERLNFNYLKQRSRCEKCQHDLSWYDLIPIISFIVLKGECRYCKHKLSYLHLIGELLALLPMTLLVWNVIYPSTTLFLAAYLFLLVAGLYDFHTHTIPLHFVLIFILVIFVLAPHIFLGQISIVLLLHLLFILAPHSIGYGDILIFSILSLVFPYLFFVMLFCMTFIIGGLFIIVFRFILQRKILAVPLIPFIFISFVMLSIFYPNLLRILHFY